MISGQTCLYKNAQPLLNSGQVAIHQQPIEALQGLQNSLIRDRAEGTSARVGSSILQELPRRLFPTILWETLLFIFRHVICKQAIHASAILGSEDMDCNQKVQAKQRLAIVDAQGYSLTLAYAVDLHEAHLP
jgi:hypothetical protein